MARAATETQRAGLGGLGFGVAIPGTVGGAVWGNAGAPGDDAAGGGPWPGAGSVFRNPSPEISAGELIDAAGLKGRRVGGAVVSERHANFIVNDAGGTADDVRRLAELVRAGGAPAPGVEPVFPGC